MERRRIVLNILLVLSGIVTVIGLIFGIWDYENWSQLTLSGNLVFIVAGVLALINDMK
jgi:hypothetical protein